eukprot:768775-Hanusia_phi.AAC.10
MRRKSSSASPAPRLPLLPLHPPSTISVISHLRCPLNIPRNHLLVASGRLDSLLLLYLEERRERWTEPALSHDVLEEEQRDAVGEAACGSQQKRGKRRRHLSALQAPIQKGTARMLPTAGI